jgi:hypothetical protein
MRNPRIRRISVQAVFIQLAQFDEKMQSSPPHWPDFDNSKLHGLHAEVRETRSTSDMYQDEILDALRIWDEMSVDSGYPGDNAVAMFLGQLVTRLQSARETADDLVGDAGRVKASAAELSASLDLYLTMMRQKQTQSETQMITSRALIKAHQHSYREARSKLEGGEGFLTGFLTGITLGIYNRVKEQQDAAKAAIRAQNAMVAQLQQEIADANLRRNAIAQVRQLTQRLQRIDRDLAASLNTLNQAFGMVAEAARKFENAQAADRPDVVRALTRVGGKRMEQLRQWAA